MAKQAIRAFAFFIVAAVGLLGVTALSASAQAQVTWDIVGTDNAGVEPNLVGVVTTPDIPVSCLNIPPASCPISGTLTIPSGALGGPGTTIDLAVDPVDAVVSLSASPTAAGDNFIIVVNKDGYNCFESNPNVLNCSYDLTQAFISLTLTEQLDDMQLSVGGDARISGDLQVAGKIIESCSLDACSAGVSTLTCGATQVEIACAGSPGPYAIGDNGPAGGIVFYLEPGSDGLHGLEVTPVDLGEAHWGCHDITWDIPGADATGIGSGAPNTLDILNGCANFHAAHMAEHYLLNGHTDWFLPSKDELNQLYLQRTVVGGFPTGHVIYWSSTEFDGNTAWAQRFDSPFQGPLSKNGLTRVRAVRAF